MANFVPWIDEIDDYQPQVGGYVFEFCTAKITGLKTGSRLDQKPGIGSNQTVTVFQGYQPVTFTLLIEAYDSNSHTELVDFVRKMRPAFNNTKKTVIPDTFDVDHPTLQIYGVTKFAIVDFNGPIISDNGLEVLTINFTEYHKPAPLPSISKVLDADTKSLQSVDAPSDVLKGLPGGGPQ